MSFFCGSLSGIPACLPTQSLRSVACANAQCTGIRAPGEQRCNGKTPQTCSSARRVSINGGAPKTLATGQLGPNAIAGDATSIYWTTYQGGNIMKLAK